MHRICDILIFCKSASLLLTCAVVIFVAPDFLGAIFSFEETLRHRVDPIEFYTGASAAIFALDTLVLLCPMAIVRHLRFAPKERKLQVRCALGFVFL